MKISIDFPVSLNDYSSVSYRRSLFLSLQRRLAPGFTRWVKIKSLAGTPCKVSPGFVGVFETSLPSVKMTEVEPRIYELGLGKGEEVILFQNSGDVMPGKHQGD